MLLRESVTRLIARWRYPVSLPEEIANDLGVSLPSTLSFKVFLRMLSSPSSKASKLHVKMPRYQAEAAFRCAIKKETFSSCSLFSYYIRNGWVVITLYFDEQNCLRRAYLQCPACEEMDGFELYLEEENLRLCPS